MKVYGDSESPFFAANVFLRPPITATHVPHIDLPDKNKSINGQLFPKYNLNLSSTALSCFATLGLWCFASLTAIHFSSTV